MKRKILAIALVLCLAAISFLSAGGSGDSSSSGKMELTFFYPVQVGGPLTKLIDQICDDFTKENPNIVIKPVYTGNYDDTVVKIQTAIQGKNPPDFFINLATQRFSMAASGAAIPLDDLIAADGAAGQAYINDFLEGFMEDSWVDGKIYSIPFQRSTMVMFYNKDAFREAGLDPEKPPVTWAQLVEYSQKLTKRDASGNVQRYGVGLALNSGSAQWGFTGFALQNSADGRNLMSEDGKKVYFDTPENVEALQFWLDLQNRYNVMQKGIVQWTDLPGQFLAGQVAMIYHTTGNLTNINNNADFEFGVCFLPGNKRQAAPTGGGNFYISAGISPERQKAAWEFIKFATTPERTAQWNVDTGYVATRKSAMNTQIMKDYYASVPQAKVAFDQIPLAKPELTTYDAARMWRILNDNIQSAVTGEATAAQALRTAQTQADEALRRYQ
ncbi:ABC transporter substrate-binding protein [Breznakiella homolactica]|uniref:ABC transporter substrate-binding protein n=1 Tax=Breznakiella homolactica TaxID=2798577 RepID=A0A7T7XLP5_9SPIR|nr:ABC transporter substrate-binding protein [Breznakiella homolactica]QQO08605.1 ABC transporter substrate-binding protein [Breznakiella homolactica]